MDRKPILFLSNFHQPTKTKITRKTKIQEKISCFTLVQGYNAHMGYADKADMWKYCY